MSSLVGKSRLEREGMPRGIPFVLGDYFVSTQAERKIASD